MLSLLPRAFAADVDQLSLAAGGTQTLTLDPGADFAGDMYLVLGSQAGAQPGIPVAPYSLCVNLDAYFLSTLAGSAAGLGGASGLLDAQAGTAAASFTVPPGSPPGLAGTVYHHAYLLLDLSPPFPAVVLASNPVELELVP